MPANAETTDHDNWGAFRFPGFRLFWFSRVLAQFSTQVLSVSVGWQVYDLTRDPFDLGLVGLVQFAPALALVLVTGAVSDRFNRRAIVAICTLLEGLCALALLLLTLRGDLHVGAIFAVLVAFGVARAFMNPAASSLVPNLVPTDHLASAIALSTASWQVATIVGPVAGGLLYGISPEAAYGGGLALFAVSAILVGLVPKPPQRTVNERTSWETVVAGFRFVWKEKVVFGAISLDLFAVLLGGAVALLPAYARDILEVGPWGLGILRSATGVGAMAVAVFGVFTLVFGISTLVWLSVLALMLAGAADMVSVYIRETLIQLWTPDAVRGRVSAVNNMFVGASNELGEFRAGTVAALIGVVPAVVVGGVGTLLVAGIWAWGFPGIRTVRRLDHPG
jgi:MFS family permease